ncbi:B12-binding domain-containing radical SAM protein [Eilatimonas milleporae]|uniref:Radical SAM family protein n=1 Tax=Eilatimonas milleporae TaxID=911205 RepID=A0A3M0CUY2_9PROT|nr:radical SAM protein [Eilatimonas milleporae]RMB12360.1 radical SAM family protein [Eilatimonas milleporae]
MTDPHRARGGDPGQDRVPHPERQSGRKTVLLIQPPYGDLTYPYHALSYVAAAVNAAGYEAEVIDLNALWLNAKLSKPAIAAWDAEVSEHIADCYARPSLEIGDQNRLADLLKIQAICRDIRPETCRRIFRSEAFYDPERYQFARRQFRMFEALLDHFYAPIDFLNAFAIPPHIDTAARLTGMVRASDRLKEELADLLRAHCRGRDYLFIGVGMQFTANIAPGFAVLDLLAEVFPGVARVAGGTAVTDLVKYARSEAALAPLSAFCEAMYAGEAEPGMAGLIDWLSGGGEAPDGVVQLDGQARERLTQPDYVSLGGREGKGGKGAGFAPFDWERFPPRFDWVDWSLYLAPERRVNYAPVRGCFWNQCTFCDYGLNSDKPTAPSRAMNAKIAVAVVRRLRDAGVIYFYLSSDALPPNFLKAFAEELIAEDIGISWSCQLFLTKTFTPEFVALLERSGLVQASFGLESGSSRVLEKMGKGTDRVDRILRPAFEAFRASNIALQPLFFMGFPGETDEDRQATVDLLLEYADIFTPISHGGRFTLLAGSILAKNPEAYGLSDLAFPENDDFSGALNYRFDGRDNPTDCELLKPFNDQLPADTAFERPWIGGIDTFHTHLYAQRHGRTVFERIRTQNRRRDENIDHVTRSPYDIPTVIENVLIHRALTCPDSRGTLPDDLQQSAEDMIRSLLPGQSQTYRLSILPYREMR